jgi:outer membrane protein assembly factor BamE (lipoprotein component of BamABCDE complex)
MIRANWKSSLVLAALLAVTATTGCRVRQTQEGKAPEVEVKGGQVPKYDVDTAKVEVGTKKEEVTVPDVNVTMPEDKDKPTTDHKPPQ